MGWLLLLQGTVFFCLQLSPKVTQPLISVSRESGAEAGSTADQHQRAAHLCLSPPLTPADPGHLLAARVSQLCFTDIFGPCCAHSSFKYEQVCALHLNKLNQGLPSLNSSLLPALTTPLSLQTLIVLKSPSEKEIPSFSSTVSHPLV